MIRLLTAKKEICEALVNMGISPSSIFWHVKEFNEDWQPGQPDEKKFYWTITKLEGEEAEFVENEIIPAWTFEELYLMLGGDIDKPDLLPQSNVPVRSVRNDDKKGNYIYYDYMYYVLDVLSAKTYPKGLGEYSQGAQACAEILRTELFKIQKLKATDESEAALKLAIINERYKFFFNKE